MRRCLLGCCLVIATITPLVGQSSAPAAPLRIYLARHGESEGNVAGVATGWTDEPLTALGRTQARELAEALTGVRLDAVYSSTLSRSRATAEAAAQGRPVQAMAGLRERNWGRFTGGRANDPEYLRRRRTPDDTLDGGESREGFFRRVQETVVDIRRRHSTGAVLIVGHGSANQQILRALLGLTPEQAELIVQANDEVYAVDLLEGRPPLLWKLIRARNLGEL